MLRLIDLFQVWKFGQPEQSETASAEGDDHSSLSDFVRALNNVDREQGLTSSDSDDLE